jgi:3-keto-disaccharide hydrolase
VENGYMEVVAGKGAIHTREVFGDCQLHLEFSTPPPKGEGQGRGNSGLFFMDLYEVQVLDSYENDTYPDGQAGAVYGQQPPLVNASRPAGEWQTYDVVFRRPRFDAGGSLASPARVTVFHNGVLVQDGTQPTGPTTWRARPGYAAHADALPISLQDHGNPMRFRNIWLRPLDDPRPQPVRLVPPGRGDDAGELAPLTGRFEQDYAIVPAKDGGLLLLQGATPITGLIPDGEDRLRGTTVGIAIEFGSRDADGRPTELTLKLGHASTRLERVE